MRLHRRGSFWRHPGVTCFFGLTLATGSLSLFINIADHQDDPTNGASGFPSAALMIPTAAGILVFAWATAAMTLGSSMLRVWPSWAPKVAKVGGGLIGALLTGVLGAVIAKTFGWA